MGSDEIVLNCDAPHDRTRVQRVCFGVLALHQDGKISDAEAVGGERLARRGSRR